MKYVVIGGVAGGPSFATRLRRIDENAEIIILERGSAISYAGCAIPYYLGGVIKNRDSLIERTPEILKQKNNIDVRLFNEVTKIDPQNKKLAVTNLKTGDEYSETYDRLVLATGARPYFPDIKGIEQADNIFAVRNMDDADAVKNFLDTEEPKSVVILGGGAIGIEIAESFTENNMDVTIVEQNGQVAYPLDEEIAEIIQADMEKNGVRILLNRQVVEFQDDGHKVLLDDDSNISTDMLFMATGVVPNVELAQDAGINLAQDHHIIVDNKFQTNIADIYAIGDVIETKSLISGQPIPSLLSSAANRQGHLLADILSGQNYEYPGFIGAGASKFFDLTSSFVGFTENELNAAGYNNYANVFITPFDHAFFFPNATRVNFKLIYDTKSGKILGGQAVGENGIDKRIYQLSVAISGHLTVYDLPQLEIPYSPPYSSTRDVLNIAGYVAINQLQNQIKTIDANDIPKAELENGFFLDIREPGKPFAGTVMASANIPLSQLRNRINEIPTDQKIYITFRKGIGPYNASTILKGKGFDVTLIKE